MFLYFFLCITDLVGNKPQSTLVHWFNCPTKQICMDLQISHWTYQLTASQIFHCCWLPIKLVHSQPWVIRLHHTCRSSMWCVDRTSVLRNRFIVILFFLGKSDRRDNLSRITREFLAEQAQSAKNLLLFQTKGHSFPDNWFYAW